MKKILLIPLFFSILSCFGQYQTVLVPHSTNPEMRQLIAEGTKYLLGTGGYEKNYSLAFDILSQAAKEKEPIAQFLLAQMYEHGQGVELDLKKALKYYKLSADNGEKAAAFELGDMHKKGKGTELSFNNAVKYFKKCSDSQSTRGQYALGYMHFKGLGTPQSYKDAVQLFEKSAKQRFAPSYFMLGYCYENGFYVSQNLQTAIEYYELAAEQNYKQAEVRLNQLNKKNLKSLTLDKTENIHTEFNEKGLIPSDFQPITPKEDLYINISGNWEGELMIYDWAGEKIMEKDYVKAEIVQDGYKVVLKWDSGLTHTKSAGFIQGNRIFFDMLNLVIEDSYGSYTEKNIEHASLLLDQSGTETFLSGDIVSSIPEIKEPGAPGYLVFKKSGTTENIKKPLINIEDKDFEFLIYPNPFNDQINIDFNLPKPGNVVVELYDIKGNKIQTLKQAEYYNEGNHQLAIPVNISTGTYLVEIQFNNTRQVRKLIKK